MSVRMITRRHVMDTNDRRLVDTFNRFTRNPMSLRIAFPRPTDNQCIGIKMSLKHDLFGISCRSTRATTSCILVYKRHQYAFYLSHLIPNVFTMSQARESVHNFAAGPSPLPTPVLQKAAEGLLNYNGSGMGVCELSHRGKDFKAIIEGAEGESSEDFSPCVC